MFINNNLLKIFYNILLTGLPSIASNPFNKNILHAPFTVKEGSTYVNFILDDNEFNCINNYLIKNTNNLKPMPINMFKNNIDNKKKQYYLSINIYNCTSPIFDFLSNEPITRCEINTYIINDNDEIGTLIIDYTSNLLSVDPDTVFKKSSLTKFIKKDNICSFYSYNNNIDFELEYDCENIFKIYKLNNELIKYSDKIFYKNGIYDKLYYDTSLINNELIIPNYYNIKFKFNGIEFKNPDSVFFFKKQLNFVGGMWDNINKI